MTAATGPSPEVATGGDGGGSRLKGRLARVSRAAWIGWGGVALALLGFYVVLPPIMLRTLWLPLVLTLAGAALGVIAVRGGERRIGGGAIITAALCLLGAYGAVSSGADSLERVVVWSALLAAALRYATPLTFAALQNGTSVRNLDPSVFDPELATNLATVIQGLIVLFVSAPVLVTMLSPSRLRRRRARRARGAEASS